VIDTINHDFYNEEWPKTNEKSLYLI
jgi:hypothetical protein